MTELNEVQESFLQRKLQNLQKSKFRSKFKLSEKEKKYIKEKGLATIEVHCKDFIAKRLSVYPIENDGKQTPMKGHPVFIAQHATATCCRSCLEKWHKISKNRALTEKEKRFIVALIMEWIRKNNN